MEPATCGVVAHGDILPPVAVAGQVVPGVGVEGIVRATGGALAGEFVVGGGQAEVEARGDAVVGVGEDVECGGGVNGFPCVGVRG